MRTQHETETPRATSAPGGSRKENKSRIWIAPATAAHPNFSLGGGVCWDEAGSGEPPRSRLFELWQASAPKPPNSSRASSRRAVQSASSTPPPLGAPCAFERGGGDFREGGSQSKARPPLALLEAKRGPHSPEFDADDLDAFKALCVRKCGTLCNAWRQFLDPNGVGRVSFISFASAARNLGFPNAKGLWMLLDTNRSGHISLDSWDPVSYRNLIELREVCMSQWGGMDTAFIHGMDRTGSRTVNLAELSQFCDDMDFSGDVKALFKALDEHRHGFITGADLEFLSRWQGERFSTRAYEIKNGCSLSRAKRNQRQRLIMREKVATEHRRENEERAKMERNRVERENMVSPSRVGSRAPSRVGPSPVLSVSVASPVTVAPLAVANAREAEPPLTFNIPESPEPVCDSPTTPDIAATVWERPRLESASPSESSTTSGPTQQSFQQQCAAPGMIDANEGPANL